MTSTMRPSGPACALLLLALALPAAPAGAQDTRPRLSFGGQIRPRFESRSPVEGSWDHFTSMRVRASLAARLEGDVKIFVQFQDVRLLGEEANTLGDFRADGLDLHQGYVELGAIPGPGGALRIGRQELALGEERLVGAVNWAQQARSFDGVRYTSPSLAGLKVDLFAMKLAENTAASQEHDRDFLGAWGALRLGAGGTLDLYGLFTTDSREAGTEERTFGALWRAEAGPVRIRVEGSVQGGTRGGEDVSAYMIAARAGTELPGIGTVTLWFDHLSGDDDPADGEVRVFSTLFATNHLYYGLADYFLNIPAHTGGLGLQDAAVKFSFAPLARTRLNVDLHRFRTARQGSLSTRTLGDEVDVTLRRPLSPGLGLMAGYSFVRAGTGMKELGRLSEDAHWFYVMLNAAF